jgi:hypothetical protein
MGAAPGFGKRFEQFKDQRPCSDEVGRGAFNPPPAHACNQPEEVDACKNPKDTSIQAKDMDRHKQTDIEGHLLRSRISANEKGKVVQGTTSIHVDQATSSTAQPTSQAARLKTVHSASSDPSSTRLQQHQMGIVISDEGWDPACEVGWEPAKLRRRKRPEAQLRTVQISKEKSMGSDFFRAKMQGRCYNCFSSNHHAHLCRFSPRC